MPAFLLFGVAIGHQRDDVCNGMGSRPSLMDCVGLLLAETQMPQVRCMGLRPGNQATVRSVRAPDFTPTLPAPKPFVCFFLRFVR